MTPPDLETARRAPNNENIPRSRESIDLPSGIRVTTIIEVKQWTDDPEGSHRQDWAATNTHVIRIQQEEAEAGKVRANPCIAVADGLTLPKGPNNISALVAQEAASRAVQEFTNQPLTLEGIQSLNNAVRQELASENGGQGNGYSTLAIAQLIPHPHGPELRLAGVGDSHLLVIYQYITGRWELVKYTDELKQDQVGKSGGLTSVIGQEPHKLSPQGLKIKIPRDTKRMIVIAASDGLVALGGPEEYLQQTIERYGRNTNGELDANLIANTLFDASQALWNRTNRRRAVQGKLPIRDDMALAIMDIDFIEPHDSISAARKTPERPQHTTKQILENLRKARIPLTSFWQRHLTPESAKPPTTQEIEQILQAIGPLTGKESPSRWAKQQAEQFMKLWNQIVEEGQPVDREQLTYVTRQAGLREILRAANKVIQNERPGLVKRICKRIKKAFRAPAPSNRIYNIFREAQASLAGTQNQIRRALQRATTLQQVMKILQRTPVLISDNGWYPTAGYQALLQQTMNTKSVPRFQSITNAAGLRDAIRRIWLEQYGDHDAFVLK